VLSGSCSAFALHRHPQAPAQGFAALQAMGESRQHTGTGRGLSSSWAWGQQGAASEGYCQLKWTTFGNLLVSAFCQP